VPVPEPDLRSTEPGPRSTEPGPRSTEPGPRPVLGRPWGAIAPEGADTALGLAARLGAYCWAEQQVFSLLGGWVPEIPEPDAKLLVAEHADHAGWRAQRWFELLPTAPPGADVLVVGPGAVVEALARLDEVADGTPPTVVRLAAAYRVLLPRLAGSLRAHLDWSPVVAEPAVGRLLRIALDDVTADWVDGERLVQALLVDAEASALAQSTTAWLDREISLVGGLIGPGSAGRRPVGGAS